LQTDIEVAVVNTLDRLVSLVSLHEDILPLEDVEHLRLLITDETITENVEKDKHSKPKLDKDSLPAHIKGSQLFLNKTTRIFS
jgi:hypothetical protein